MPLILPSNSISAVGYEVDNSLRFNDGSSDALIRTLPDPGGAGNRNKWTFSTWLKRGQLGTNQWIFGSYQSANYQTAILFKSDDTLDFFDYYNGSFNGRRRTNRVFRDTSAWYHIVAIWDKDNATTSEKMRVYVNGVEETSFQASSDPSNATTLNADNQDISVGQKEGVGDYFDGYLSETVFNDGQAYTSDNYGEFDADTGIWKPIDVSGLTFGTNGFYLDFENSGSLGADVSGNGNNFTVNNLTSIDQTTDTPTNNYSTANGIMGNLTATFSNGNLTVASTGGGNFGGASTLGLTQGKWYAEFKITAQSSPVGHLGIDGDPQESARNDHFAGENAWSYGYNGGTGNKFNNNSGTSYGDTFTLNDIIMVAMDLDNNYVYFGKNGTWQNSGDPTSGASGTGSAFSISSSPPSGAYFFVSGDGSGSNSATIAHNYGNPPFTISSGNSDGNGYGNFEYSVPSGYYALNTKNLAEYG